MSTGSAFTGVLFAPAFAAALAGPVAAHLGVTVAPLEEREFEGGEHKARPLSEVRGRNAYVVGSLDGDRAMSANDKLCRVLFLAGALVEASARSVTVVAPYLCYSRKDRQTKARDPVTTRYVAQLFEAVGVDRVVTLDVHNLAAFQNAFRARTDHLEATQLVVDYVLGPGSGLAAGDEVVVVSPDVGGMKRAARLRDRLAAESGRQVGLAFLEKERSRGVVSGPLEVHGTVAGRAAVVYDDMISSGTTMLRAARSLRDGGATAVHLVATHGLFTPEAEGLFGVPEVDRVVVTDSVRADRVPAEVAGDRLVVLAVGALLGEAIARIDGGGSLVELLHLDT